MRRPSTLWWLSLPLIAYLTLPLLALVLRGSPADLANGLGSPTVWQAVRVSVLTTLTATALSIGLGTPLALWLSRGKDRARRLVTALVELPTVLPPAVAGLALLVTFGRRGLIGQHLAPFGLDLAFTPAAVVLAQLFIAVPLYVKAAEVAFGGIERELEQAASIDGASQWQIFRHVSVPMVLPALVSGAVLAWARALGEFGATIIFAGNFAGRTQTMPLAIYLGLELDLSIALTLSLILIGLAGLALLCLRLLTR